MMTGYAYGGRVYAVKRIMVDNRLDETSYKNEKVLKEYHEKFYDAMKECCITRICGVFGIGPRPVKPMGFDLIIYENCIDFCVEKCEELQYEKLKEKV